MQNNKVNNKTSNKANSEISNKANDKTGSKTNARASAETRTLFEKSSLIELNAFNSFQNQKIFFSKQKSIALLSIAFLFLFFCSSAIAFSFEQDVSLESLECPSSIKENSTARIALKARNWSWLEASATAFVSLENANVKPKSLRSSFHYSIYSNKPKTISNDIISGFYAMQPFVIAEATMSGFGSKRTLNFQAKPVKNATSIKVFAHVNTESNSSPNYGIEYSQFGFNAMTCEIQIIKNKVIKNKTAKTKK